MAVSSQLITDLKTAYSTGVSSQSSQNAIAPAGVIEDLPGNIQLCIVGLSDTKRRLLEILKDIDAADPMLATLQNVSNTIV
jgi:hypothetical protein